MRPYILQRLLSTLPVLLGVVTLAFFILRILPGDPASILTAQGGGSAPDAARLRAEYGLDRPLWAQYLSFLFDLARGHLGYSLFTGQPISQVIAQQAPATFALACAAMGVAVCVGGPLGIFAAARRASWADKMAIGLATMSISVPVSLSGLALMWVFSLLLHWLPATGRGTPGQLIMPACALGFASAGSVARLMRTQLGEVLAQEYIYVARAKGLNERTILLRHALRNALIPTLTVVGLQFGFMLSGAAVTESVFARQGLGRTLVDAILSQDYPLVQGIVLVNAAIYMLINLAIDLIYGYLDPRIHHE